MPNRILRALLLLLTFLLPGMSAGWLSPARASNEPLDPNQAFRFEARQIDRHTLEARWRIAEGYYLYRDKFRFEIEPATIQPGTPQLPAGQTHDDDNFGKVDIYRDTVSIRLPIEFLDKPAGNSTTLTSPVSLTLKVRSQGCADLGVCYPPLSQQATLSWQGLPAPAASGNTRTAPPLALPAGMPPWTSLSQSAPAPAAALTDTPAHRATDTAPLSFAPAATPSPSPREATDETSRIARLLRDASLGSSLLFFFGAGLALAFTPCMFPMIPILSGLIIGHGHDISKARAFLLSTAYVLGMSLCYAALGVVAGLSGTLVSSALQNAWFLGAGALVFIALALSMFGVYKLQLPSFLQSRLSEEANRQQGGSLHGAWLMGAISAAIVGPCVAAPLAGALLHIAKSGDALLGGSALFIMGLGMGLPLIVAGTSARHLLPRPGPWMTAVNRLFGVLLLGVALWLVSPLLHPSIQMLAWAALLIFPAIYLRALDPLPPRAHDWQRFGKGVGIMALLTGAALLLGVLGGSRDPLQPLAFLRATAHAETSAPVRFTRIKTLAELESLRQTPGAPILLDFYADWCISCKEMERLTFADPAVATQMKRLRLLQVDVTADTAEDRALLKHFDLFGPPALIFFDGHGKPLDALRTIGFQPPEAFLKTLQAIPQTTP